MRGGRGFLYVRRVPRRPPINPTGYYHVSSRGCYGRTLFDTHAQHEVFLRMYMRSARKYGWETPSWALMENHHHFVIRLTGGGLSEGMRELHGGYSRWIHALYGQTRQGHLFRHAFFARELSTEADVLVACCYVDLNASAAHLTRDPRRDGVVRLQRNDRARAPASLPYAIGASRTDQPSTRSRSSCLPASRPRTTGRSRPRPVAKRRGST